MKLIILGYGNLAQAIIPSIAANATEIGISQIEVCGRNPRKIDALINLIAKENPKVQISTAVSTDVDIKDSVLLLCVKPMVISEFNFYNRAHSVISFMAGGFECVRKIDTHLLCFGMPNIAAKYSCSSSAVFFEKSEEKRAHLVCSIMKSFGNCVVLDSLSKLQASIATNGSSLAILSLVAQGIINSGVYNGLQDAEAKELVYQTFKGFYELLSEYTPQDIKEKVSSPNGTTVRALLCCDINGVQGNITKALNDAVELLKCRS